MVTILRIGLSMEVQFAIGEQIKGPIAGRKVRQSAGQATWGKSNQRLASTSWAGNFAGRPAYSYFNYMVSADPRSFLPLKPVDLELLLALADGDLHGYGLVQAIAARTDDLVVLDPGNLYRVIKRLLADGLIAESDRNTADEKRKYYRLTPLGGRVLASELDRLRRLVSAPAIRQSIKRWTS